MLPSDCTGTIEYPRSSPAYPGREHVQVLAPTTLLSPSHPPSAVQMCVTQGYAHRLVRCLYGVCKRAPYRVHYNSPMYLYVYAAEVRPQGYQVSVLRQLVCTRACPRYVANYTPEYGPATQI
jgi:hypothetical protein